MGNLCPLPSDGYCPDGDDGEDFRWKRTGLVDVLERPSGPKALQLDDRLAPMILESEWEEVVPEVRSSQVQSPSMCFSPKALIRVDVGLRAMTLRCGPEEAEPRVTPSSEHTPSTAAPTSPKSFAWSEDAIQDGMSAFRDTPALIAEAPSSPYASAGCEPGQSVAPHEVDPLRRKRLSQIAESNYRCRKKWPIPKTCAFEQAKCAAKEAKLKKRGGAPKVSFSGWSTADAMLYFAHQKHVVCGLNFGNGSKVGGGYKNGSVAQEEDLCRRIPTLYTSLLKAKSAGHYPFGPSTCKSPDQPKKYSDVLFTPDISLARAGEEWLYEILPPEQQAKVSLVTAAAPNINFANEVSDLGLMYNTVKNIMIAPQVLQPKVTTLVLGAWGCGAFGCCPMDISELFARALADDTLGNYYQEVHFAIPKAEGADCNAEIFRSAFKKRHIEFFEM